MELTVEMLKSIYPYRAIGMSEAKVNDLLNRFVPLLNKHLPTYGITTPLRIAHFLAQVMHESGGFRYQKELASGAAYDTGRLAVMLGNTPQADGDGQLYKGRGLIQLTGRANYQAFEKWLGGEPKVYSNPSLVEQDNLSVLAAVFYWSSRNLNQWADKDDVNTVTKRINGGFNGLEDRKNILAKAKSVLGIK